jgi:excisionase family DNA binding protein
MSFQRVIEKEKERLNGVLDSPEWAGKPVFTVRETAKILRLSLLKVYQLIQAEELPAIRLGRNIRVARRTLAGLLGE